MELDKRIVDDRKYLDIFDTEEAQKYVGTKCYFTNRIDRFSNLDDTQLVKATLTDVKTDLQRCFVSDEIGVDGNYRSCFILPCEWVKRSEKKYRPYKDVKEMFDDLDVHIGDVIHFRKKFDESEYNELITGTCCDSKGVSEVCIGGYYTMQELFDLLELSSDSGWIPFGKEKTEE